MLRQVNGCHRAICRDFKSHGGASCFGTRDVIKDRGLAGKTGPGPVPVRKSLLDGLVSTVHIEIACAIPGERRVIEADLNMGARRDGRPAMAAVRSEIGGEVWEYFGLKDDSAAQRSHREGRLFVDLDAQPRTFPDDGAWTYAEPIDARPKRFAATLCHRPSAYTGSVDCHVQRAMLSRVDVAAKPSLSGIVRGKNATDECDDRQSEAVVGAERIDIPPGVTIWRNRFIEAKSWRRASDASCPESAAIGIPGPGCTLPPAK